MSVLSRVFGRRSCVEQGLEKELGLDQAAELQLLREKPYIMSIKRIGGGVLPAGFTELTIRRGEKSSTIRLNISPDDHIMLRNLVD